MMQNKVMPKLRFREFSGAWERKKIREATSLIKDGSHGTHIDTIGSKYYLLSAKNIQNGDVLIDIKDRTISESEFKSIYKNYALKEGDILLSIVGTIGRLAIYKNEYEYYAFQRSVAFLRFINLNSTFIYHFLTSSYFQNELKIRQVVSAQPGIYLNDLGKIMVSFPSLAEQEKIANYLSALDEKISLLSAKEKELLRYKKAMMQKLFAQEIRFKDDEGKEFAEWEEDIIANRFDISRGYVLAVGELSNVQTEEYQYPVYSSQTKENGLTGFFDKYLYENAITWTTDGANAGTVSYRKGKFYCTNVCGVLISKEGFANQCIAEMLNLVTKRYVSYVGNPKLMNNIMAKIPIKFPSLGEQQKIADFLSAIDEKINKVQEQIEQTKSFKKAMLQQMFV